MKLILCVVLIVAVVCYLSGLLIRQAYNLKKQIDDLQSENIEQNKRLLRLELRCKQIEKAIDNEERDNSRENKTSNKPIRRNR